MLKLARRLEPGYGPCMWSRIFIVAMFFAIILGALGMLVGGYHIANAQEPVRRLTCNVKWVHDGDTFRCDGYKKSTRLYGVDPVLAVRGVPASLVIPMAAGITLSV